MPDVKNNVAVISSCGPNCSEDAGGYSMRLNVDPELTLSDNQPGNYYLAEEGCMVLIVLENRD